MESRYTVLQFKRFLKRFPLIFLLTMVTLSVIVAGAGLIVQKDSDKVSKKVSIGITGDIEDTYLEVGIYALKNLDSSRFTVDFQTMTLPEAKTALAKKEIYGYVQFPPGFIEGIERGENKPAIYVVNKNTVNFGTVMTEEISTMVSDLVVEVQRAVYSMRSVAKKAGITKGLGKRAMDMNEMIIKKVLSRNNLYEVETLGVRDNLSFGGYYLGAVIIFFLLLWGLSFSGVLGGKSMEIKRLLKSSGISEAKQIKSEFLPFFSGTVFVMVLLSVIFWAFADPSSLGIIELEGVGGYEIALFMLAILPVIIMMCSMHFFIYELIDSLVGAVLFQIILALVGGYISGCFYPGFFFPDLVTKIADLLPIGAGFSYIRKILSGTLSAGTFFAVAIYSVVFLALSVKLRKIRMAGDGR